MSYRKPTNQTNAAREERARWFAAQLKRPVSNASLCEECSQLHGISKQEARIELEQVLKDLHKAEVRLGPELKYKFLELGFALLDEARQVGQYSAAIAQFKYLCQISGLEGPAGIVVGLPAVTGSPDLTSAQSMRERISALLGSRDVRSKAEELGVELAAAVTVRSDGTEN